MVVEHDTIEEYVEVLSSFDSTDQLRLIAALTERLVDKVAEQVNGSVKGAEVPVPSTETPKTEVPEPSEDDSVNSPALKLRLDPDWDPKAELAAIKKAHREKYGEVGDSWKSLAGIWKDTMPDDIEERLRADRMPPREVPDLDIR